MNASAIIQRAGPAPFLVTRRTLNQIFASPRLVQRMLVAGWFEIVRAGGPGRETLYDFDSARRAFARLKAGEEPPLLRCEVLHKEDA